MKNIGLLLLSSLLGAVLGIFLYRWLEEPRQVIIREKLPASFTPTNFGSDPFSDEWPARIPALSATDFTRAAEAVTAAVVNIKTRSSGRGFDFWGGSLSTSTGSGVVISSDGYIVTNYHVVEGSEEILVTFSDKREMTANLIGADPSTDLALIKVQAEDLPRLEFGNSDSLRIGEWVMAVGNPFNLESTVTAGIVSAKGRSIDILEGQDRIESFIQTDAAVNPGNSGGALVDTRGSLIGINTAIITRSGRYEGYSFAVPGNLVRKVIKDLREFGVVQRGLLGVFIDGMTSERAESLGLPTVEGVYITRVTPGSGADDAGLRRGDVIIGINGVKTKTLPEMQEQVGRYRPGDHIEVEFIRKGNRQRIDVTLKNKTNSTTLLSAADEDILEQVGFELRNLTRDERRRMETRGVRVISIRRGSIIENTNMDPGFIITSLNGKDVRDVEGLIDALQQAEGEIMLEGVYEKYAGQYYYTFRLDD